MVAPARCVSAAGSYHKHRFLAGDACIRCKAARPKSAVKDTGATSEATASRGPSTGFETRSARETPVGVASTPRVRVPVRVPPDSPAFGVAIPAGDYEAFWNRFGAVSVPVRGGYLVGLKPAEFEWIEARPKPTGTGKDGTEYYEPRQPASKEDNSAVADVVRRDVPSGPQVAAAPTDRDSAVLPDGRGVASRAGDAREPVQAGGHDALELPTATRKGLIECGWFGPVCEACGWPFPECGCPSTILARADRSATAKSTSQPASASAAASGSQPSAPSGVGLGHSLSLVSPVVPVASPQAAVLPGGAAGIVEPKAAPPSPITFAEAMVALERDIDAIENDYQPNLLAPAVWEARELGARGVDDDKYASWVIGKLLDRAAQQKRVKAQAAAMVGELEADIRGLVWRFGRALETWAEPKIAAGRKGARSFKSLSGTIGSRGGESEKAKARFRVVNAEALRAWILAQDNPEAYGTYDFVVSEDKVLKYAKASGECPPGVETFVTPLTWHVKADGVSVNLTKASTAPAPIAADNDEEDGDES